MERWQTTATARASGEGAWEMVRVLRCWWAGFGDLLAIEDGIANPTPTQRKRFTRLKRRLAELGEGDAWLGLVRLAEELPDDPFTAYRFVSHRLRGGRRIRS